EVHDAAEEAARLGQALLDLVENRTKNHRRCLSLTRVPTAVSVLSLSGTKIYVLSLWCATGGKWIALRAHILHTAARPLRGNTDLLCLTREIFPPPNPPPPRPGNRITPKPGATVRVPPS